MAKMFGKATVNQDGRELLKKQDGKLNLGGVNRNVVKGNDVYGYAEEAMEATCEINVLISADTDIDVINKATDVTILFTLDSGQQYVLAHAWCAKPIEISEATDGGSASVTFNAVKAEKV